MIYVTHDQVETITMGNRMVVLKEGLIQQVDTPLHIYESPTNKFVAGFIGSPSMNFLRGRIRRENGLWFDKGGIQIKISPSRERKMGRHLDREVIFGIRPEHMRDANDTATLEDFTEIALRVEVIEPMGHETYLYLAAGSGTIIARLGSQVSAEVGRTKAIAVDIAKAHFFDAETEEAIIKNLVLLLVSKSKLIYDPKPTTIWLTSSNFGGDIAIARLRRRQG